LFYLTTNPLTPATAPPALTALFTTPSATPPAPCRVANRPYATMGWSRDCSQAANDPMNLKIRFNGKERKED